MLDRLVIFAMLIAQIVEYVIIALVCVLVLRAMPAEIVQQLMSMRC